MSTQATSRRRSTVARCKRHGLVLVDENECALCKKTGSARNASPWIIASVGGVVLGGLFGVRWLDRADPPAARETRAAERPALTTRTERARPAFERVPARSRESAPTERWSAPAAERAPSSADERSTGDEAPAAEDRLLGQPSPPPEPAAKRPPPPEAPGARGFPTVPREDDPSDFE
jgi:hypothetical protein